LSPELAAEPGLVRNDRSAFPAKRCHIASSTADRCAIGVITLAMNLR
jgi:hypothetical protein